MKGTKQEAKKQRRGLTFGNGKAHNKTSLNEKIFRTDTSCFPNKYGAELGRLSIQVLGVSNGLGFGFIFSLETLQLNNSLKVLPVKQCY